MISLARAGSQIELWINVAMVSVVSCFLLACNEGDSFDASDPRSTFVQRPTLKQERSATPRDPKACFQITNGIATHAREWPAVVQIKTVMGSKFSSCTATFVGQDVLLSAAHCLRDNQTSAAAPVTRMIAVVNGSEIEVSRVFFSRWAGSGNSTVEYDLAILQLEKKVATAFYPIAVKPPELGEKFVIVGYGAWVTGETTEASGNTSHDLYYGMNKVAALDYNIIWSYGESGAAVTSSKGENSVAAPGDSGGPLIIDKTLVGVESFGTGTIDLGFFHVAVPALSPNPSHTTFQTDALALERRLPILAEIEKEVKAGRKLSLNAHMDLTSKDYMTWLRELARQGLDIRFSDSTTDATQKHGGSIALDNPSKPAPSESSSESCD